MYVSTLRPSSPQNDFAPFCCANDGSSCKGLAQLSVNNRENLTQPQPLIFPQTDRLNLSRQQIPITFPFLS